MAWYDHWKAVKLALRRSHAGSYPETITLVPSPRLTLNLLVGYCNRGVQDAENFVFVHHTEMPRPATSARELP